MTRYAAYYAPAPESALDRFGSEWLARDMPGDITAIPRHYGLHATLKPPFALAAGFTEDDLATACAEVASKHTAFDGPPLALADMAGFLALASRERCVLLHALADEVVRTLDRFRAVTTAADMRRRGHDGLTARQRELLERWGYPYVLDEWRFHITLTGRLEPAMCAAARTTLEPLVAPFVARPPRIDAITLFVETDVDRPFRRLARFPFAGTA